MDELDNLKAELEDARKRRNRLRFHAREFAHGTWERGLWNASINVVKKTVRRLKKEIAEMEEAKNMQVNV